MHRLFPYKSCLKSFNPIFTFKRKYLLHLRPTKTPAHLFDLSVIKAHQIYDYLGITFQLMKEAFEDLNLTLFKDIFKPYFSTFPPNVRVVLHCKTHKIKHNTIRTIRTNKINLKSYKSVFEDPKKPTNFPFQSN